MMTAIRTTQESASRAWTKRNPIAVRARSFVTLNSEPKPTR
jgi:hypothetical protein